jgi:nucleotide-binding universal stress UspA family protein
MERIVVGVDGSDGSRAALAWAVDEAKLRNAQVVAVIAWESPVVTAGPAVPVPPPVPDDTYEQAARAAVDDAVQAVLGNEAPVPIEPAPRFGPPGPVLCEEANGAALLVVGASGHGALVGMLLGSISEYCTHHAPCPVVLVRPAAAS